MSRKEDHLDLTLKSQVKVSNLDHRFNYEPIFGHHQNYDEVELGLTMLGKFFKYPLWFSSMTGGAEQAKNINTNMAIVAKKFGLGMGLGSCRSLLTDDTHLADFKLRSILGDDRALYANLGIAQIEKLVAEKKYIKIVELVKKVEADGLIVHVNPLQEWFQPEGDKINKPILQTLENLVDHLDIKIVVKEVGHGFGPRSLMALNKMGLAGIELAGFGGTNFSALEALRMPLSEKTTTSTGLINVGHSALDMISSINNFVSTAKDNWSTDIIISGGVQGPVDAYYLRSKLMVPSLIGQASQILERAKISSEVLEAYVANFLDTYVLAKNFLTLRS